MYRKKLKAIITITVSVFILTIGSLLFVQIKSNHQANEAFVDKCFENFDKRGEVVLIKDGFWSPFSCEEN